MKWESASTLVVAAHVSAACADSKPAAPPATTALASAASVATGATAAASAHATAPAPACGDDDHVRHDLDRNDRVRRNERLGLNLREPLGVVSDQPRRRDLFGYGIVK